MAKDTIRDWSPEAIGQDGVPAERHLGRFAIGGLIGALLVLLIIALSAWIFHRTLFAAGASHVVLGELETVVRADDLAVIDDEFDRAAAWYVDGRLELPALVRAMQVVMAADIVAYVATQTMREVISGWPGIRTDEADLLARRIGGGIVARRVEPVALADAFGTACRRSGPGEPIDADESWSRSFLFYGDRLQIATSPTEAEAQAAVIAVRSYLDMQSPEAAPLRGDLRSHLRERLDGEVGWQLDR